MFGRLALPSSAPSYTRRACIGNWANRPRVRVNRSRIYDSRGELVAIDDATLSYCDATLKLNTNVCETILLSDELRVWCEIRLRPSFIFFTSFWNCIIICTYYTSPPLPVINARRRSSAGLDLKNNMCTRCSLAGDVSTYNSRMRSVRSNNKSGNRIFRAIASACTTGHLVDRFLV